jgi:hypothetical protein
MYPKNNEEGQVSTITEAFSQVGTRPCCQDQGLSMTENNFLFLIRQKKQFLENDFPPQAG